MKRTTPKRKATARSRTTAQTTVTLAGKLAASAMSAVDYGASVSNGRISSNSCSTNYSFRGELGAKAEAPPAPPSIIESQFYSLKDELGVLERAITDLQNKIEPVLTPIPPSPVGAAGGVGADMPASLMSNRLAGLIEFVRGQTGRVASLIERVEA